MKDWFRQLDRLLRGDEMREALARGEIELQVGGLALVAILMGAIYGVCMGVFALTGSGSNAPIQIVASAVKVPALFLLTLAVTFPSLYVFNALMGSRLGMVSVLRLLVASIGIMMTVLASLGPIVAFFALTTTSYPFMKLLNVAAFSVAGFLGGGFLLRTLHRLTLVEEPRTWRMSPPPRADAPSVPPVVSQPGDPQPPIPHQPATPPQHVITPMFPPLKPGASVRAIFRVWVLVFGLVGAQMAWIMRPFIGDPNQPFSWFRPKQSNIFEAIVAALVHLFGGRW
jgi:hypothetical protein